MTDRVYAAFFDEMSKLSDGTADVVDPTAQAPEKKKSQAWELSKVVGAGALGIGAGTAGGLLAGYGADKLLKATTGRRIPPSVAYGVIPAVGAAGGIAYAIHKAKEQEAIRRALQDTTDHKPG